MCHALCAKVGQLAAPSCLAIALASAEALCVGGRLYSLPAVAGAHYVRRRRIEVEAAEAKTI